MKAVKCPVCKGDGRVKERIYELPGVYSTRGSKCYGCNGKGWVEVSE